MFNFARNEGEARKGPRIVGVSRTHFFDLPIRRLRTYILYF